MEKHSPVMVGEVVRHLSFEGEGWIVDGTLGPGGHATALLQSCPDARLLGIDLDHETIAATRRKMAHFGSRFIAAQGDYSDMEAIMKREGIAAARAILLDLGWSSAQLSNADRGFSFSHPGPLDMRYDQNSGTPFGQWLEEASVSELTRVIREYGEERWAAQIARKLKGRQEGTPKDTSELAEVVASAIPRRSWPHHIHPATRAFQAFRIATNDELNRLERFLDGGWKLLRVGGRMAVISFHSLEDRRVKQRFAQLSSACECPPGLPVCRCGKISQVRLLTRRANRPQDEEIEQNPRSRSARLRAAERIE